MPPRKRTTKRPRRKRITRLPYSRWLTTRAYIEDDEVHEQAMSYQTCLNCYTNFQFDWHQKFDIRNRFCPTCRREMPFKKWLLLRKFHRVLEEALNKREPANDITRGSIMQYVNGVFQSLKHDKSREFLVETISCVVDIAHLATPIELSQLMEVYDAVTGAKKKHRTNKKKRRQPSKKNV